MSAESIYQKYMGAIQQVTGDGTWVDWGVVRLALHLAVQDAHTAGAETPSASQDTALQNALDKIDALRRERNAQPDQRTCELLQAQINRLNEWLAEHEPGLFISPGDTADAISKVLELQRQQLTDLRGSISTVQSQREMALRFANSEIAELRQQLTQMDSDNAGLTRRCTGLEAVVSDVMQQRDAAQQEIDRLTHQNVIAVDTFNSLSEPATNGNGASPAADEPLSTTTWYQHLDDETNDWRVSIEAGRRTFRQVPKAQRLLLGAGRRPACRRWQATQADSFRSRQTALDARRRRTGAGIRLQLGRTADRDTFRGGAI